MLSKVTPLYDLVVIFHITACTFTNDFIFLKFSNTYSKMTKPCIC